VGESEVRDWNCVCLRLWLVLPILCVCECGYCWEFCVCESVVSVENFVSLRVWLVLGIMCA
jgi:hypothetical protein